MTSIRPRRWTRRGETVEKYQLDYRDAAGRRRRALFDTRAAAEAERDRVVAGIAAGTRSAAGETVTVAGACQMFVDRRGQAVARGELAPETLADYENCLGLYVAPVAAVRRGEAVTITADRPDAIGRVPLARLTAPMVEAYKDRLAAAGHSLNTRRKALKHLRMVLNEAVRSGLIDRSPADKVRVQGRAGSAAAGETDPVPVPQRDDLAALLEAARAAGDGGPGDDRGMGDGGDGGEGGGMGGGAGDGRPSLETAWTMTALFAGLRPSEMRGLQARDLVLRRATPVIRVRRSRDRQGREGAVKTENARRDVPIGPALAQTLRLWCVGGGIAGDTLVFAGPGGGPMRASNFDRRTWHPLATAAGWRFETRDEAGRLTASSSRFTLYALRHAYAALMIAQGIELKELSARMGHSSIVVTADIYGFLFDDRDRNAAIAGAIERSLLG